MCASALPPESAGRTGNVPNSAAAQTGDANQQPMSAADVDLDVVASALSKLGYEPVVADTPCSDRRIFLIGHGGHLGIGRFGWLLASPGHPPHSLHDAEGRWITLGAAPEDVASAVTATDRHSPRLTHQP
jgi:hypothetical protein